MDAFDVDSASIEAARRHARDPGVSKRATLHDADAGSLGFERDFDVVTAFECIPDLPRPVTVLHYAQPGNR